MIKAFIFGSCRIWDTTNFCAQLNIRTLMHDISQYIQEIQFYRSTKSISNQDENMKYMYYNNYRTLLTNQKETILQSQLDSVNSADIIIVEICTLKYIQVNDVYYDLQMCAKYKNLISAIKKYDEKLFLEKMEQFIKMLPNKKILFVGHIYDKERMAGTKLEVRKILNGWISKSVDNINTHFLDLSSLFETHTYEKIMSDTEHYSKVGKKIIRSKLKTVLANLLN